ncbi:BlaI/MecI/CopY family transcriptional regulator [Nocardioides aquiterrae]|uniref:BlaI/MecI/CopY family transcriptional regulator n=1 Tax=Nocardioides aquiterrae TaxID=203799 RepID=A0ABN1UA29_9ACTN
MRPFGDLEAAIMRVVWEHGEPISVRVIVDRLNEEREVAYTTVITVAERLREKGLLTRVRRGRAFLYQACLSADDYSAELMRQALNSAESRSATLLRFAGQLSIAEADSLRAALAESQRNDTAEELE